jgi:hypothetical protein
VYVQRKRKYKAVISIAGIEIANGSLIIQKATAQKYSIGVILNSFPPNFPAKKLSENDYGDYDQLGESPNDMTRIIESLYDLFYKSIDENSNIKFARFIDEQFYEKTEDVHFQGIVNSIGVTNISQTSNDKYKHQSLYINKENNAEKSALIFLDKTTFAPQIRLMFLLKNVIHCSGYELIGDITRDDKVNRLFYQSMKSLDVSENHTISIYSKIPHFYPEISLKKNTPNLTNSEIINTIKKLLGCTFYINSQSKKIEMSFIKDLHQAGYIDLTKYCLTKETIIEEKENTIYSYQLGAIEEKEIPPEKLIEFNGDEQDSYPIIGNLSEKEKIRHALYSKNKIHYSSQKNSYQISKMDPDTGMWKWVLYSGNTKKNIQFKTKRL